MKNEYVLGFLRHRGDVLLIRKTRPAWQHGFLNGIGGKIEPGESPNEAMAREAAEEAGLQRGPGNWRPVCVMGGSDWRVHVFTAESDPDEMNSARSLTDEELSIEAVHGLAERDLIISNLPWLLAMCEDKELRGKRIVVDYDGGAELAAANARAEAAERERDVARKDCDGFAARYRDDGERMRDLCGEVWRVGGFDGPEGLAHLARDRGSQFVAGVVRERDAALATLARVDAALEGLRNGSQRAPCIEGCTSFEYPRHCTCGTRDRNDVREDERETVLAAIAAAREGK